MFVFLPQGHTNVAFNGDELVKAPERSQDKEKESRAKIDDPWEVPEMIDDSTKWGGKYWEGEGGGTPWATPAVQTWRLFIHRRN